jgi:hypothetical protein
MAMPDRFARIAVEKSTQRKIALLSAILGKDMYEIVANWADREWAIAKKAGLVKDSMLEPEKQVT